MPETNVLYSVTGAVVVGLVAWVAVVLKSANEPWARPAARTRHTDDVAVEAEAKADAEVKADADDKAEADARVEAKADDAAK